MNQSIVHAVFYKLGSGCSAGYRLRGRPGCRHYLGMKKGPANIFIDLSFFGLTNT